MGASPVAECDPRLGPELTSTGLLLPRRHSSRGRCVQSWPRPARKTILYNFTGQADGGDPRRCDPATRQATSTGPRDQGSTTYRMSRVDVQSWMRPGQETVLYNFTGAADGSYPNASVVRDSAGNLYGTTHGGGATTNLGVVYKLDAAGQETVLYTFPFGADGAQPEAGVIRDSAGHLYGTTLNGGTASVGVVCKLDAAGQETVLHSFTGGTDGEYPYAGVTRDSAGNLYGTTQGGGTGNAGVVYKLDPSGQETVLYSFSGGADGGYPDASVIQDSVGNLYGTTFNGGTANMGVVYKLDVGGQETVLYSFTGGADGASPYAGVIRDSAGDLYGTTVEGGTAGWGVVYKLDASGQETVLYSFMGGADGGDPYAGVIRDPAGNLYGTTLFGTYGSGNVYKLDTTGQETVLYSFTNGADGGYPYAGVIRDSVGNLYGTTYNGGKDIAGVVFKLTPAP